MSLKFIADSANQVPCHRVKPDKVSVVIGLIGKVCSKQLAGYFSLLYKLAVCQPGEANCKLPPANRN